MFEFKKTRKLLPGESDGLMNSCNCLCQGPWGEWRHVVSVMGSNPTNCVSTAAKRQLICK
jgi:hypothetical protein